MWNDPDPDPGGSSSQGAAKAYSTHELSELRDQNEHQLVLIAQLKEMLRKEQSNVPQEKVEEYVNTLGRRTKRGKIKKDNASGTQSANTNIDSLKKDKINLLRQQLEENKAKLAERGKSQKGIEEMVTQLQTQMNEYQVNITPLSSAVVDPKTVNYSKNTPPEELYNILLTREKKISELVNKVQKLEGNVLDLQENLKEKDVVIDARTKAITLMTDSLSKKGKNTLDALEDTKEQMRKMQENFIKLESDMKARQISLLNDLKVKNMQISDLEEEKMSLKKLLNEGHQGNDDETIILMKHLEDAKTENEQHLAEISELQQKLAGSENLNLELEKKINESSTELKRLQDILASGISTELSSESTSKEKDEIIKLKKQLDDSNKNMIKIKAQNKNKIKELDKKITQLKKSSDGNTLIDDLLSDNTKLSEKVAELEEELGNMQLKMVDSISSSNGSSKLEEVIKELEETIAKKNEEICEKDKIISLLETEIITLKEETNAQDDKIKNLSRLEVQVSSEMNSINYEEQLDKIEQDRKSLLEEKEEAIKEKANLLEKIDLLKKEKHDLAAKLDSYIQENMELIDKLEKLSAEKVSSAESIEIVEGLTQQEKLELAAYQKHIDVTIEESEHKCPEEDHLETPAELNESVMQLSEDSAELLQKIDMFTSERKEVMQKMEILKEENNMLNLRIKEVENNRDVLAETYEQLQNEKEELQTKLENMEKSAEDAQEIKGLQENFEKLYKENEELKRTLKKFESIIHEKNELDDKMKVAQRKCEELESVIQSNLEEINNYKSVIEENKHTLIGSSSVIDDLQNQLSHKETDIQELNKMIEDLNRIVIEQTNDAKVENLESTLTELKLALNNQLEQTQDYETELNQNSEVIKQLNLEIMDMNRRTVENATQLESKISELKTKEEIIRNLQESIEQKDTNFSAVNEEIRGKYLALQKQLDSNDHNLHEKVNELSKKNKEQLDKMKKIAANLKKKTQQYQELDEKYNLDKEKWEVESKEKDATISQSNEKLSKTLQQLKELEEEINLKNSQLEASARQIRTLLDQIEEVSNNNQELQNTIQELRRKETKIQEISLQQELSTSLHEEFDTPIASVDMRDEKVRELEMIIETNEQDIHNYRDRISKLESDIIRIEEQKNMLERKNNELEEKLSLTSNSFKEKAMLEDQLELKLAEISATDDMLNRKFQETDKENKELLKKKSENEELIKKLKIKLKKAHDKVNELKNVQTELKDLENINDELKKQIVTLETSQRQIQTENESLQKRNLSDYDKIEADYQVQLEELSRSKNDLSVECEKLQDKINELLGKEEEIQLEIEEYKLKLRQNEQQICDLTVEVDRFTTDNKKLKTELDKMKLLKQQVEELQNELLRYTAKSTVENIIEEAVLKISSVGCQTEITDLIKPVEVGLEIPIEATIEGEVLTSIPTFHWPGQLDSQPGTSNQVAMQVFEEPVQEKNKLLHNANVASISDWFNNPEEPKTNQDETVDWFNQPESSSTNQGTGWPGMHKVQQQPEQANSPIQQKVISKPEGQTFIVENSKEALLNKIKTLEFLLYNVDKEKEIALSECTDMINELSQIIYDKVNEPETKPSIRQLSAAPISNLETQIMSEQDITDASNKQVLQQLEFSATLPSLGPRSQPVVEDILEPKQAYLTYIQDKENSQQQLLDLSQQLSLKCQELENINLLLIQHQNNHQRAEEEISILKNQLQQKELQLITHQKELQGEYEQIIFNKEFTINELLAEVANLKTQLSEQINVISEQNKKLAELQETIENQVKKMEQLEKQQSFQQAQSVTQSDIPSQIMSDEAIAEASNKKVLQDLEFSRINPSLGEQSRPVIEEVPQPKRAYLTYSEDKPQSFEAFEENDDGWGWGPEEARLEEEHIQKTESTPQIQNLRQQIEHLHEQLRILQVERENHLEEIKQLQVKSGKLIKKCKELKVQNEQLVKKSAGDDNFFNLDETIQEELKSQVEQLEKTLKELKEELDKEKQEKSNIVKRVDVLTSANERMVEMKEIQDTEVLRWQRKYNEALEKLQKYEWGNDGFEEKVTQDHFVQGSDDSKKIEELEKTLGELSLDNEELQALLEEQRKLRIDAESSVKNINKEENYLDLLKCKESLEHRVSELEIKLAQQHQNQSKIEPNMAETIERLQIDIREKEEQLKQLQTLSMEKDSIIQNLKDQFDLRSNIESNLRVKVENLEKLLKEKEVVINDLQADFDKINHKKVELDDQISHLTKEVNQQKTFIEQVQVQTQQNDTVEKLEQQIVNLKANLHEKEKAVEQFNIQFENVSKTNKILELEISELKHSLNQKQQENDNLKTQISQLENNQHNRDNEFEEKLKQTIAEISANWATQVDQRGADVAESWKLHLESVESEFASVQLKLKEDIAELEEKCNALVNENNELRKNVDAKIRQEVDRISALQQQINNNQQIIAGLNNTLNEKQREIESLSNKTNELEQLRIELAEKENKLANISIVIETTQKQFDEKREVVEEIVKILEKNTSWPVSYEKQDVLNEFQRQLNHTYEKEQEIMRLNQIHMETVAHKDVEIDRLSKTIDEFQKKLNTIETKEEEIKRLNHDIDNLQVQLQLLAEKDSEISRLNNLVENYKESQTLTIQELQRIQQDHQNCSLVLQDYQQQLVGWQQSYEVLNQSLEEKGQQVTSLTLQLQKVEEGKLDNNKEVETLHIEIAQAKEDCATLQLSLSEVQKQLFNVTEQLTQRTEDLETVQQQLNYSQQNYELSQEEVRKLTQQLQQTDFEYNTAVDNLKQNELRDLERHYEELISAKELDIRSLRAQLAELLVNNTGYTEKLNAEMNSKQQLEIQVSDLQEKLSEQTTLVEEENKQLMELRQIIEKQVLKIEELKKELFEKSNQYDSIIAEMDIGRSAITQQPSSSVASSPTILEKHDKEDDLSEPVSRAELDLALYMLHQRDVRCEELMVELTQLLEERDTLQLRLSNAIREKEEFRKKVDGSQEVVNIPGTSSSASSPSKASEIFLAASGTELAKDLLESDQLATKLSELKRVGYKKDKTFVDEQEKRRHQQMSIMQQHIQEASKLPPEAAAKLVDASYTLSRDVQSPSKVLLNWLWGRSTPKVDDT